MKIIPVKLRNKKASVPMKVDDYDYEMLSKHRWCFDSHGYPMTGRKVDGKHKNYWAHKVIMECPESMTIDHIDRDVLNNQRSNLRIASKAENARNRKMHRGNTSGYKGVSWKAKNKKWQAQITKDGKGKYLGLFSSPIDASNAYQEAAKELFGEYASR